jgi:CRISPR/Cas system-associated exonuclease Cas4 (RecB family)
MAMGYSVVRGQRAVYWDRYEISGHIDGYLTKLGGDEVLIEVKSCSPFAFVRFQTIEDVKNAKKYYYRKWVHQLNIYQLLEPAEEAWLVLKNKATGELRILPHPLDYQLGEETLKKAELVKNMVDAARGQELPEGWLKPNRLNDAEICLECPFKAICCPEIDAGVGILFSEDGEMAEALKHWESTAQASEEHEELDKGIKAKAKFCFDAGSKEILCGEFVIKGTKIEPKGKQPYWKTEINRIAPGSTAE